MFNKEKSPEFIAHMYKDKTGANNPMYGKAKGPETLAPAARARRGPGPAAPLN